MSGPHMVRMLRAVRSQTMEATSPDHRAPELESLLRSPAQRVVLVVALVVVAALLMTAHLQELFAATRNPEPWGEIFAHQLLMWSLWGAVGVALVRIAVWLRARWSSWLLFAAVQVPLSVGVAALFAQGYDLTAQWIYSQPPARPLGPPGPNPPRPRLDPEGFPLPGQPPGGAPIPAYAGSPFGDPGRGFPVRLRFNLAVYWLVLGIGAGVHAFLRANERERLAAQLRL